jgi:hypothetical protein
MIRPGAVVGLALLCAFLLCAFAPQSASAKGTTAYVCKSGSGKDFADAHCYTEEAGKGTYGHASIEPNTIFGVTTTNTETKNATKEWTAAVFAGTAFGEAFEISCARVAGAGVWENKEISKVMQTEGTQLSLRFIDCTVLKPANCAIQEIVLKATSLTTEEFGTAKNEMGILYKPEAGKPFGEFTIEGAACPLKGKAIKAEGSFFGRGSRGVDEKTTSSSATLEFTKASTEGLTFAGGKGSLEGTLTMLGYPSPLTLTTTETPAIGTAMFACVSGITSDFGDSHCDTPQVGGAYGHEEIPLNQIQPIVTTAEGTKNATKEWTPTVLTGIFSLTNLEVSCGRVSGTGTVTNKEIGGAGAWQNEGTSLTIRLYGCTVIKPAKCAIQEIVLKATSITVENLGLTKDEMGVEYKPSEKNFGSLVFEGAECALKGKTVNLEGTLIGTGKRGTKKEISSSGGTLDFTKGMTENTLKIGGEKATLESTLTMARAPVVLTLTTTEP